ncbi:MAG: dihydrofolate reductase family protein [Chloroflexi bacterium]|nr:dihydrofolate reductase family protein [Chloroflexota bacterium]
MTKIAVFNHVTIDGFFAGPNGEIDWFKVIKQDDEWDKYTRRQAKSAGSTLMFGHTTYEMMRNFWSTPEAINIDPIMAEVMGSNPKIVFSRTLESVEEGPNWKNIRLFHEIKSQEILELKEKEDITIMGSGTIVQQLANLRFIDEYSLVVVPIILGSGKPLFKDAKKMNLKLLEARAFKNGIVLLKYSPA